MIILQIDVPQIRRIGEDVGGKVSEVIKAQIKARQIYGRNTWIQSRYWVVRYVEREIRTTTVHIK